MLCFYNEPFGGLFTFKEVRQAIDWYIPHEVKNLHVYRCVLPFHGDKKRVCFLCKSESTGAECESQAAKMLFCLVWILRGLNSI